MMVAILANLQDRQDRDAQESASLGSRNQPAGNDEPPEREAAPVERPGSATGPAQRRLR